MKDAITVKTDLFEHRELKPHFINLCCFGEDFAAWLRDQLTLNGFTFSNPIQEDYGWGLRAIFSKHSFWIAISYVGNGPQEQTPEWIISISDDPGRNIWKHLFRRSDRQAFNILRDRAWSVLRSHPEIKILGSLPIC